MSKKPRRKVRATARKSAPRNASPGAVAPAVTSKLDRIVSALRAPKGATVAELMKLTGWQAHSVRGALSGSLKKARGIAIISSKAGAERAYRIDNK